MQELFDLFEEIGLPYYRQGSMSDEDYKPSFFTFWNHDTPEDSFYDNMATREIPFVQIGFYTNDIRLLYSQLDKGGEFRKKAKAKGFIFASGAYDANADKADYFGRACIIKISNKIQEE